MLEAIARQSVGRTGDSRLRSGRGRSKATAFDRRRTSLSWQEDFGSSASGHEMCKLGIIVADTSAARTLASGTFQGHGGLLFTAMLASIFVLGVGARGLASERHIRLAVGTDQVVGNRTRWVDDGSWRRTKPSTSFKLR